MAILIEEKLVAMGIVSHGRKVQKVLISAIIQKPVAQILKRAGTLKLISSATTRMAAAVEAASVVAAKLITGTAEVTAALVQQEV